MFRKLVPSLIVFFGGFVAFPWLILWKMDLSLALGTSAKESALTFTVTITGIALGALWAGKRIKFSTPQHPWRFYGILMIATGILAWLPTVLKPLTQAGDAAIYQSASFLATPFSALMLAVVIGPASFAMGAAISAMGLIARKSGAAHSRYLAATVAGAAIGCLFLVYFLMPTFGKIDSGIALTAIAIGILASTWKLQVAQISPDSEKNAKRKQKKNAPKTSPPLSARNAFIFAAGVGLVIFMLQVSWFRILRSSWLSTSDTSVILAFLFLGAFAIGAGLSKRLRNLGVSLAVLLALAGIATLIATPFLERFDQWGNASGSYSGRAFLRLVSVFVVSGPALVLLGIAVPWLLDEAKEKPRDAAKVIGIFAIAAVVGSLGTSWLFLEMVGPVITSWIAAFVLTAIALPFLRMWRGRFELLVPKLMIFAVAWWANSGIGSKRIQGPTKALRSGVKIIDTETTPTATTSVARVEDGSNVLFVDGYASEGEYGELSQYLDSMGRLPMLLHANPQDALVISFGTGLTARTILDENPARLTVVDSNPSVFKMAEHFKTNREVLEDGRVRVRIMDGRSWLRKTEDLYDVISVKPMTPFFEEGNSLYTVEFYELLSSRMREDGFVAQWFPIHLMTPQHARSVAAAFKRVFPNSLLWFDPNNVDPNGVTQQGILIGRKGDNEWDYWPGFTRPAAKPRPLDFEQVSNNVLLSASDLAHYVEGVQPVTDNNRLLAFDREALHRLDLSKRLPAAENMQTLFALKKWLNEQNAGTEN